MNRAGEKDTLITYERALEAQADLRKFRGSTIERKQMSTKTTFKRVALVAVAALGLGVLSVAPSQAAHIGDTLTLTPVTSAITVGETATATVNSSFTAQANNDSITVNAIQLSPATTSGSLAFSIVDSRTGTTHSGVGSAAISTGVTTAPGVAVTNYTLSFVSPTTAGTYVIQVYASAGTGSGTIRSSILTWTVTVAAAAKASAAYIHLVGGATPTANPTLTQTDSVVAGSKAASVTAIGAVGASLLNAAGAAVSESYTATITGAGTLGFTTPLGRSLAVKNNSEVRIYPDGTGGVGTITLTSAAGVVLGSKTVTFYGDPSVIVLSSRSNAVVGTLPSPIRATVYDANGYPVAGVQLYATSSDTTVISDSYQRVNKINLTSAATTSATGVVDVPLTGVKLGSAKITVGLATSATDVTTTGYAVKSDALTVTVGPSTTEQAGVVVTTDKQVYTPGSYAYVTVKAVDKTGATLSPLPDSTTARTIFATGGISGSLPFETVTGNIASTGFVPAFVAGTATAADPIVAQPGEYVYKIKLPTYAGDFSLSWTTAAASHFPGNIAAGGVAGSTTVTLSDPGSQAAVDAAAEATDAANAATDAALAAADAADAATAAAEDASASVAKLSKSVTTALNNLKKQITSLTALVNKLLKR
jgi:trimeric autotransporter adhesin